MRNDDDLTAIRLIINGRPTWQFPDGTTVPVVSGGDGTGDGTSDGDGTGEGSGEGDGTGDSSLDDLAALATELGLTPAQIAGRLKASRTWENRAKANAKATTELEKLRTQSMSDQEKAVAEAEKRGRETATADFGKQLAAAKIEAALTGVVPDPSAVVEDLNLMKYVTDTGDVDTEAIATLRDKYAGLTGGNNGNGSDDDKSTKRKADLKQGNRGKSGGGKPQLSRADLQSMTPEQIAQAHEEGRLNEMQGLPTT